MDLRTIQQCRNSFTAFLDRVSIDTDDGPRPLASCIDPWQREDFLALSNAVHVAAGLPPDPSRPVYQRALLERPRGHSKTGDIALLAVWCLFASQRPLTAVAAAADSDQARLIRDAIARLVAANDWLAPLFDVQASRVRNTQTGGELTIISSDAGSSYGLLCDVVICDEVVHWTPAAEALWVSLLSTAAKRKRCALFVISNAGVGQGSSWQWRVREMFRTDPACYFHRLDGPVASWLSPELIEQLRRMLPPAAFARLVMNVWSTGEGDALPEENIRASLVLPGPIRERQDGWGYVAGVDLGIAKDCSAVVVVGKNFFDRGVPPGTLRVCDVKAWKPRPGQRVRVEDIERHLLEVHERYRPECVGFDPWQSEFLAQRLSDAHLPCLQVPMTAKNLQAMATSVTESFSERTIQLFDDPQLLADLRSLRVVEKNYGWRLDPVRNADGHGDRAMALALALHAASSSLAGPPADPKLVGEMLAFQRNQRRRWRPY